MCQRRRSGENLFRVFALELRQQIRGIGCRHRFRRSQSDRETQPA